MTTQLETDLCEWPEIHALTAWQIADLAAHLEGKVEEIHSIGSCREPGLIADAIADGARVGHLI